MRTGYSCTQTGKGMDDKGWFRGDKMEKELLIESEKDPFYPRADFMKEIEEAAWGSSKQKRELISP